MKLIAHHTNHPTNTPPPPPDPHRPPRRLCGLPQGLSTGGREVSREQRGVGSQGQARRLLQSGYRHRLVRANTATAVPVLDGVSTPPLQQATRTATACEALSHLLRRPTPTARRLPGRRWTRGHVRGRCSAPGHHPSCVWRQQQNDCAQIETDQVGRCIG